MARILLHYVLPLALPALVFVGWVLLTRKEDGKDLSTLDRLQKGPWYWILVIGLTLTLGGLAAIAAFEGAPPGGTYQAPRFEDGRIIPGQLN